MDIIEPPITEHVVHEMEALLSLRSLLEMQNLEP